MPGRHTGSQESHGSPLLHATISFITILIWLAGDVCAQDFTEMARQARMEAEQQMHREIPTPSISVRLGPPVTALGSAIAPRFRPRRGLSASDMFSMVHGTRSVSPQFFRNSRIFRLASRFFLRRAGMTPETVKSSTTAMSGFRQVMSEICPSPPTCNRFYPYRTADGTCNNLIYPLLGSQSTPQPRHLFAAYNDTFQLEEPRQLGVRGQYLPSARFVSNKVHRGVGTEAGAPDVTLFLMQWGQFTDHDLVLTPIATETDHTPIECCTDGVQTPNQHPECFHITLPGPPFGAPPDPYFPAHYNCLNFVRSTPAISSDCSPGQRQQLNRVTSYIDASNVYGSTQEEQNRLRARFGGRLKSRGRNLPADPTPDCELSNDPVDYCLIAGDERVMEQPSLSMIHTIFMREHNRIARILSRLQPSWDDEKLFQETRKIVAAEMQHITYNEYLPIILGRPYMNFFRLLSRPFGFDYVYNQYIDASIVNVFAAASFRFGHSQVPNVLQNNDLINGPSFLPRQLEDTFFQPNMVLRPAGADRLARYAATANSHVVDSRIEQSVRNKLFKSRNNPLDSLDLAALNIQRGRDHGLPPYNAYRRLCGHAPYLTWNDAVDHSPADILKLRSAYSDPRDIDVFTGALSERPVPGGMVGPTNACILANQFRSLKIGDRFFYENPFPLTGFTQGQLSSIKTATLARIICRNSNTSRIQPNVFRKAGPGNQLRICGQLPDIDFTRYWSGTQAFQFPVPAAPQPQFSRGVGHQIRPVAQVQSPVAVLQSRGVQRISDFLVPNMG